MDLGVKEEGDSEEFSKEEGEDFEGEMEVAVHPNQNTEDDKEEEEVRMGEAASEVECPCDGCDEKFSSAEPLREHMLKHPKTLACKVCKKQFKKPCFLRNHFPVHKSKLDCPMCRKKKTFWGRAQLEAHIRLRHNNTFFRCEDCGRNLCSLQSLRAHQRVHQSQRRVNSCDNCGRGFGSYGGFRRHKCVRYVDIQWPFACSICSYQTSSPSSLAIHEDTTKRRRSPAMSATTRPSLLQP